ncbi:PREDICTED: unc-112-related protein isoform X2 [Dinoponera quadriceps]|uniref:Unc-112-related protein isoform X2 n=1 Tax=Dinoponera quadriceps TaxID=609295 RepID=A0A6P3WZG8_DINQU|nr:PREDICTED: unc-112-related protein isoform X2 [Dinoponera quadriceps]
MSGLYRRIVDYRPYSGRESRVLLGASCASSCIANGGSWNSASSESRVRLSTEKLGPKARSTNMYSDGGHEVDGSWVLRVYVTDLQVERSLRVKGELHIGGVMLRLVEDLDIAMDWSDHALWWPARNHWLTRTRSTLDQYGVAADAQLHFTPMHKTLRVQLPDMRCLDCRVDFSVKTFNAVINLCKELGIRHPEELSFCKPLEPNHLKYNLKDLPAKKKTENPKNGHWNVSADTNTFIPASQSPRGSTGSLDQSNPFMCAPVTPNRNHSTPISSPVSHTGTWKRNNNSSGFGSTGSFNANNSTMSLEALNGGLSESLAQSPTSISPEVRAKLIRPKSLIERARMNVSWLDSSLSIMEQGIREFDTLRLKFKFYSFYDLNPKTDAVRINMIYEQAKWQLLAEEIDCTEEEMLMFAALQVQVNLQASVPQPATYDSNGATSPVEDDIDAALTDLQVTLEGSNISNGPSDITQVPELCDELRFFKPKRFTLKAFKRYWFTCRDLHLRLYKSREETSGSESPTYMISLRGCEVTPDVQLSQGRYGIRLEVPSAEGMTEMWIRCDNEQQYAKWMAACRLGAKGRTLADASYEGEVNSIIAFLQLQRPAPAPAINPSSLDIVPEDYVAPRFAKKFKGKLVQRILEAHANVKDLPLVEAKLNYIKAWQSLPEYGISLFIVRFKNKDELLGIANNRLMRMELHSGDHLKTWRYNTMKAWNVNWEVKHMMVQFEEENIIFECQSADCKVVHEFIGGYIFLSMRSKEANQTLNEEMFHKLTGGWV